MKIVIADDEYLVRKSLESMIEELGGSCTVAGEATNGRQLVELVAKVRPDVAFVDIRMPLLNGLDGIRAAKEIAPSTSWVVLTGFSEFEYAKEAIELGVANYLLKPIKLKELQETLARISEARAQACLLENKALERDLAAAYQGYGTFPFEEEDPGTRNYVAVATVADSCLGENEKARRQQRFHERLSELAASYRGATGRIANVYLPGGELVTVVAAGKSGSDREFLEDALSGIGRLLAECSDEAFALTGLRSAEVDSVRELVAHTNKLLTGAAARVAAGIGRVNADRDGDELSAGARSISERLVRLAKAYEEKSYTAYMEVLTEREGRLGEGWEMLGDTNVARYVRAALGLEVKPGEDLLQQLKDYGRVLLNASAGERTTDLVSSMKRMIQEEYMNDLGIGTLAKRLEVTPNYLSAKFHKQTGTTFVKHLTRIRIIKAQELLSETELQIQQVAEKVGYFSSRHFTKQFADLVGVSPSEYRKRFVAALHGKEDKR